MRVELSARAAPVDADTRQAILRALPPAYYEGSFDSVQHELAAVRGGFHADRLEEVIETRTSMLEVMSEMLAAHVLEHYDKFMEGIATVSTFERHLEKAVSLVRFARRELQLELHNVDAGYCIITQSAFKGRLLALLDVLSALATVRELPSALRSASFGQAFWLCAQAWKTLSALPQAHVVTAAMATVDGRYQATADALQSALQVVCANFSPDVYVNVLEGFMFLGTLGTLSNEVSACYGNAVTAATLESVQGVLDGRPGAAPHSIASMHEAVRLVPPDLFKPALQKVLAAVYDLLISHHRMARWHEEAIVRNRAQLDHLQERGNSLTSAQESFGGSPQLSLVSQADHRTLIERTPPNGEGAAVGEPAQPAAAPMPETQPQVAASSLSAIGSQPTPAAAAHSATTGSPNSTRDRPTLKRGDMATAAAPPSERRRQTQDKIEAAAAAVAEEASWGDSLVALHAGLLSGRRFIWEEASRKIGILALLPAALQPEHCVQVLGWVSEALSLGEAFSGDDSRQLRAALSAAAQESFSGMHSALLMKLQAALGKESWRRADIEASGIPDLESVLRPPHRGSTSGGQSAFEEAVAQGNPWQQKVKQNATGRGVSVKLPAPHQAAASTISADWGSAANGSAPKAAQGKIGTPPAVLTATSMQLVLRLRDYCELLRVLQPAPHVFNGLCQLFELLLLHIFATFSGANLTELISDIPLPRNSAEDAVSPRLRKLLVRICGAPWLEEFRSSYIRSAGLFSSRQTMDTPAAGLVSSASMGNLDAALQRIRAEVPSLKGFTDSGSFTALSPSSAASAVQRSARSADAAAPLYRPQELLKRPASTLAAGGTWNLAQRAIAAGALATVVTQLRGTKAAVSKLLPAADAPAVDAFFRSVDAAEDVRDAVLRAAARAALQLAELPEEIAATNYDIQEVPPDTAPWVSEAGHELSAFALRIAAAAAALSPAATNQLWRHAAAFLAEAVLSGFSQLRGKCSMAGRGAMASDLAELAGLAKAAAPADAGVAAALQASIHLVDAWIKAFYIDTDAELVRWAETHAEYPTEALLALTHAVADWRGLLKSRRIALVAAVTAAAVGSA